MIKPGIYSNTCSDNKSSIPGVQCTIKYNHVFIVTVILTG